MTQAADAPGRVLIFAPIGRDAPLTRELLARASVTSEVCASVGEVCTGIEEGIAALLLTEEIFDSDGFEAVAQTLREQPPWSEIAVLLFAGTEGSDSVRTIEALERLPNVTLLDRPIRIAVVISIVRAAIRARRRQLEVRDLLVALHAARGEAEAAGRLKDEFLATLSHELRTPLNAIIGWTAMLRNGKVDPARVQHGLEVIDRNARAQAQLVEDVLDMARVITGNLRLELKPVSLGPIVDAALEALRPAAEAKAVTLEVDPRTEPPVLRADADRLQQVLWNLLSNAVKFTPSGGRVTLRISSPDSQIHVSVIDTGIGLDPQFMPYVFDRFRQADQSTTRGHGGLGLGLAIVKHLVELQGGRVEAHSAGLGQGATFTVILPIPGVLIGRAAADSPADAFDIRLTGRSVLVVDDDAGTRELLSEIFTQADADVRTADCAAAAYAAVQSRAPDVIIADIGLPGEDGHSLMRRIRALPAPDRQVPAIALSAYTRQEDRDTAYASGFTEFIGKPAAPEDLLTAVDRLIGASAPSRGR